MKTKLKIDIESLRKGPIELDFEATPEDFDLTGDPEFTFTNNLTGHFTAKHVGGENVALMGRLSTHAQAPCVRCLHALDYPIDIKIEALFMPMPERLDKETDPLEAEKIYYESGVIYPMEKIREEIMLQLPFLPSCQLQKDNICPIRNVKVEPATFASSEEPAQPTTHEESEHAPVNSWKDQLAQVRKKMQTGEEQS